MAGTGIDDRIERQPSGQLNKRDRQTTRVVNERFVTRERFKEAFRGWLTWQTAAVGAGAAAIGFWEKIVALFTKAAGGH